MQREWKVEKDRKSPNLIQIGQNHQSLLDTKCRTMELWNYVYFLLGTCKNTAKPQISIVTYGS